MKHYRITLEDHTFDVNLLDDPRQEQVRVEVDGETFTVEVEVVPEVAEAAPAIAVLPVTRDGMVTPSSRPSPSPSGAGESSVTAPLPGVIKSIAVRTGQRVAADDQLLVIEAMKMDNVIRASRAGTIGTIHVTEGRQVAYGEILLSFAN
jgi:biotin carboxyl carrier protein